MIITSVARIHTTEGDVESQTRPELLLEIPDAIVRGVVPFLAEEHPLTLPLGMSWPVWHDSTSWRVEVPGWGEHYAAYVVEWPVLDTLPQDTRYVLTAQEEDGREVVRLTPA